jgi:hypothetical protein
MTCLPSESTGKLLTFNAYKITTQPVKAENGMKRRRRDRERERDRGRDKRFMTDFSNVKKNLKKKYV